MFFHKKVPITEMNGSSGVVDDGQVVVVVVVVVLFFCSFFVLLLVLVLVLVLCLVLVFVFVLLVFVLLVVVVFFLVVVLLLLLFFVLFLFVFLFLFFVLSLFLFLFFLFLFFLLLFFFLLFFFELYILIIHVFTYNHIYLYFKKSLDDCNIFRCTELFICGKTLFSNLKQKTIALWKISSWELTPLPPWGIFEDDFSFPKVGYVRFPRGYPFFSVQKRLHCIAILNCWRVNGSPWEWFIASI